MILFKFIFIIGIFVLNTQAECPITENPRAILECLRYISSALYGAAVQDLKIVCSLASDVANCARRELGECVAAEIGLAALNQIRDIADNCCPERNKGRCPIRDSVLNEQRCFAGDSFVTLSNGHRKSIVDLQINDSLLAYDDQSKTIISTKLLTMLDYQPQQFALFKQVTTTTGRQLSLSSSHLLPTETFGYRMAKDIHIGMNIYVLTNDNLLISETVTNVTDVVKQGYIAPLTEKGTLIVNNIAASCYATINSHSVAHFVLSPMRWWYKLFGTSKISEESIGVHWFPKMIYEITNFLLPSIIQK